MVTLIYHFPYNYIIPSSNVYYEKPSQFKVPVKIFSRFRLLQTAQITPAPQIQNMMDFHSIETKGTDCFMSFNTVFFGKDKDTLSN